MNFISDMIQLSDLRGEDESAYDIRIATLNVHNFAIGGIRAYRLNQIAGLMNDEDAVKTETISGCILHLAVR